MSIEVISAFAGVGTLLVIVATAIAAFIQLRHLENTNRLAVLNDFRLEYERVSGPANAALPGILSKLDDPDTRRELLGPGTPAWLAPVAPLLRLFETLGAYTNRKLVSKDLICDLWSPVILGVWQQCGPLIAVMRRKGGPSLYENWEAIAVLSERWLAEDHESFPKNLRRMDVHDPWADVDAAGDAKPAAD
jgi:hypothetical protein